MGIRMERLNLTATAERLGVTASALSKAVKVGRVSPPDADGCFDPVAVAAQWEANRHRRRRRDRAAEPPPPAGEPGTSGYWESRARREAAEAELAELKAAEARGDLVRRAAIVQEFSTKLTALREALETLAARLAPQMVAESDLASCQRLLRDEHRTALSAFIAADAALLAQEAQQ
jgi:hypothetical protein